MKRAKTPVQSPYTFKKVNDSVLSRYGPKPEKESLRQIAKSYGVSHAVIQRILLGVEPKSPRIRKRLNLLPLTTVPTCVRCGDAHVTKRCTKLARSRRYRDLWEMPTAELARRLRERTDAE